MTDDYPTVKDAVDALFSSATGATEAKIQVDADPKAIMTMTIMLEGLFWEYRQGRIKLEEYARPVISVASEIFPGAGKYEYFGILMDMAIDGTDGRDFAEELARRCKKVGIDIYLDVSFAGYRADQPQ